MDTAKKTGMPKHLKENYSQLRVNVKKETHEIWKEYAASKGMSMYALVNKFFTDAMEADGFVPKEKGEE